MVSTPQISIGSADLSHHRDSGIWQTHTLPFPIPSPLYAAPYPRCAPYPPSPGRLPHQQGLCEARLGYRDGSPQLGASRHS